MLRKEKKRNEISVREKGENPSGMLLFTRLLTGCYISSGSDRDLTKLFEIDKIISKSHSTLRVLFVGSDEITFTAIV